MKAVVRTRTPQKAKERVAVGIDPSRSDLQVALLSPSEEKPLTKRIALGPGSVNVLDDFLQGREAVIAMEGSHSVGQLFLMELLAHNHQVYEVHPVASKRFREALTEDHTDEKDASGLALWKADLPLVSFSEEQATCKRLTRLRHQLKQDQTRYFNRLHACLSETYGVSYKALFSDLTTKKALHFFKQYPSINDALADEATVSSQVGTQAWEQLEQAGRWREGAYLRCLKVEVQTLVSHILSMEERLAELDREMKEVASDSQAQILLTMPQVGVKTALTVVGESGDVSRFEGSSDRYVAYCGLAPVTRQSGAGKTWTRRRRRYNRYLRQAFLYLAFNQIRLQAEAREYYDRKRAQGKSHWAALTGLARYLCRIVFRMLSSGMTYQQVRNRLSLTT